MQYSLELWLPARRGFAHKDSMFQRNPFRHGKVAVDGGRISRECNTSRRLRRQLVRASSMDGASLSNFGTFQPLFSSGRGLSQYTGD